MNSELSLPTITPLSGGDWPALTAMFKDNFAEDIYYPIMRHKFRLARLMPNFALRHLLGEVYILRVQGISAGFVILKPMSSGELHLHYMAVALPYRKQGLGRRLVEFACQQANKRSAILSLETTAGTAAARLYRQLGFSVQREMPSYIWTGLQSPHTNRFSEGVFWQSLSPLYTPCDLGELIGKDIAGLPPEITAWTRLPFAFLKERLLGCRQAVVAVTVEQRIFAAFRLTIYQQKPNIRIIGHFRTAPVSRMILIQALAGLPAWSGQESTDLQLIDTEQTDPDVLSEAGYIPGRQYVYMRKLSQ